jgi:aminomethyltransferase
MVVNASNRIKIIDWLNQHRQSWNVQIQDQTIETCMLAVQGPKALEICRGLTDADASQLKYYFAAPTRCRGKQCVISRTGYTGEDGIEIMIGKDMAVELADELVARGAKPCGLGARDTLRLEAAMPLYGHELMENIDPLQAGLAWAVKCDKGEFIGRSSLQQREKMPRRIRIGLQLEGKRAAREGCFVYGGPQEIGKVTSGSFAPTLQKSIAMAYVEPANSAAGSHVEVDIRGDRVPATVVKLPFYRRT